MQSRLTTATMYGSLMDTLRANQRNIQNLQQQIATGNKYTKLSDNPSAISRSLTVQSALNANEQYQDNTSNAMTMLRHADSALQNVLDAAKSIRNLIIEAGDGALDETQLKDITQQIEANKKIMLDNLNTKVAGQYLFGGTDTSRKPFIEKSDGSIEYQGNDDRLKYVLSESLLGDVSFAGSDIVPENEDTYFICSHKVPLDWRWTGREEKVQITVGNRTLAVFIPEDWNDSYVGKTNKYSDDVPDQYETQGLNYTDANGFRDPNELSGLSLEDLVSIVNSSLEEQGADMLVNAYIEYDYDNGTQQLFLRSNTGEKVGITGWPDTDYMPTCAEIRSRDLIDDGETEGWNAEGSKITISTLDGSVPATTIEFVSSDEDETYNESTNTYTIHADSSPEQLAAKINSIEGIYARHSAGSNAIVIQAQRIGDLPADRLHIDEAQEALHYPSLIIKAEGGAEKMFDGLTIDKDGVGSAIIHHGNRNVDQSHIDVFDYLGMETATKSREFAPDEKLTVKAGEQLHWRVVSGGRSVDIKLNSGEYTIDQLAERLKNAGAGWLEVTVEPGGHDVSEAGKEFHSADSEQETKRIVMRGLDGEQVIFLDMNEYHYADKMNLSTALRTDAYDDKHTPDDPDDDYLGMGMKCINFPSAPCVDDNVGIPMRVQMNCGMYYDIDIKKADVVDKKTGFVDRALLMQEIVAQVNEIEGHDIMGFAQHVDGTGQNINGSCSIYFLSGEAFTVVDMPFNDPEWDDYSGGLATQLGIHGGVSSNLKQTHIKMTDDATFEKAYADYSGDDELKFKPGTIRFSNLGHSVDIDVSAEDTVKDVMDRLRVQAGDWLYVNYYDEHMGQDATRNTGDFPLISISSKDGSAVNVLDIKGHIAEDALGLSTGIQSRLTSDDSPNGIMEFEWDIENENFPAEKLNITVAGYTHTIDLTALRDVTNDDAIKADDIAEFINARMQDEDVRALINDDNELVVYSPRGYSVEVEFDDKDTTDDFIKGEFDFVLSRTHYRGGYNLEGKAYYDSKNDKAPRGVEIDDDGELGDLYGTGAHTQNATVRSGANTARQNGFGVINDVMAAIKSGNREDLAEKMLPRIDGFINNILSVMAEDGALQARYEYNTQRLITENSVMTEEKDSLVSADPADVISQLMMADYMYQANLAVIARLIQPSLLDFLG